MYSFVFLNNRIFTLTIYKVKKTALIGAFFYLNNILGSTFQKNTELTIIFTFGAMFSPPKSD